MVVKWLDDRGESLLFDSYVYELPSFAAVKEDGVLSVEEYEHQRERVLRLFRDLEEALSGEAKALATDALCELAVLNQLTVMMARPLVDPDPQAGSSGAAPLDHSTQRDLYQILINTAMMRHENNANILQDVAK
jgi:hypothetical protein